MAKHKYGLLLSQLLDCVSRPLEEEQVWAVCFEICQNLLNYPGETDSNPSNETAMSHCWEVTFAVETIYLRRDGRIQFIPNSNFAKKPAEKSQEYLTKQMKGLSKVLTTCLENGSPKEFLKRQVGSDLESLMRNLAIGKFSNNGPEWVDMTSDCCRRHASSQTLVTPSEYYTKICELLAKEAIEMNNFLVVVTNEITRCESRQDAFSTFQISQARPVISNWLQCMSEIRDDTIQKYGSQNEALHSPLQPTESYHDRKKTTKFPVICQSPPRSISSNLPKIDEEVQSPENVAALPKPSYQSTPTVVSNKTRKLLRPPQRLVNQVTTWILEGQPKDSSCSYDVSWLQEQNHSPVSSSLGWFREAKRIRHVLTELQIDTAMDDETLYNALCNSEICFCCRVTKFSLFHRSYMDCEVCERKICSSCITRVPLHELGMNSHDSTMGSHDSGMSSQDFESFSREEIDGDNGGIFRQIRRVFKPKANSGEKYSNMCKDCWDFIQRYF